MKIFIDNEIWEINIVNLVYVIMFVYKCIISINLMYFDFLIFNLLVEYNVKWIWRGIINVELNFVIYDLFFIFFIGIENEKERNIWCLLCV